MTIRKGDVYRIDFPPPEGSGIGFPHYAVVIQCNDFNNSRIATVMVCELTTVLKRADAPGNVLLVPGEANLPEQSVVNVSRVTTVDKRELGYKPGSLSHSRMQEVMKGIYLVLEGERVEA